MAKKFSLESVLTLSDKMTAPMGRVAKQMDKFGKNMQKNFGGVGKQIGKLDQQINKGIRIAGTAAFAAFGAGVAIATGEYIKFDQAITQAGAKFKDLDTSSNTYKTSLEALGKEARRVAAITEFMATDTAGALDKMAMAGLSSELSMSLLSGTTDLATAAGTDLTTAVDIATDSLGAFNLMSDDAAQTTANLTRISDVFAKTTTTSNTDLLALFEAAKSGAPAFTAAGQSIESFSAIIGTMANAGIKGSESGTSLRNMMLRLADATPEAQKVLNSLGVTTRDEAGNFRDIIDILADFEKGLDGMGTAQRTAALATVFGARSVTGVNILLQTGTKTLREYRGQLEASAGSAAKMADAMRKSLTNQIEVLKSTLLEKGLQIVERFAERGSELLEKFTLSIRDIDIEPLIKGFERFLSIVVGAIKFLEIFGPAILAIAAAIKVLTAVQSAYNVVLLITKAIAKPSILIAYAIIAAVALLIAGIVLLVKHWDKVVGVFKVVGSAIAGFFIGAWNGLIDVLKVVGGFFKKVGQTMIKWMLTPINLMIDAVGGLLRVLAKIPGLGDLVGGAADAIDAFQAKANMTITGSADAYDYASPWTKGNVSRSVSESRQTVVNEVYVRPDKGAAISGARGGAPQQVLMYGAAQ
jgi:TP901 family phage tail tape measure protein